MLAGSAAGQTTRPATGPAVPDHIELQREVVYAKAGDLELKLNLARPKVINGKAPALVVIHGGGWSRGSKNQHDGTIIEAASRGYVAVAVGYRLAPKHPFPAQVHDVKAAVRFLRAHADKYQIDPNRIGAIGLSAGAHLAMMLATTEKDDGLEGDGGWPEHSSKVQACVSFFGPTDLTAPELLPDASPILRDFLGASMSQKPELYKQASPIHYVRQGAAPMLLFQGTIDILVNYKQALRMAEKLTAVGVEGRVELLIGAGHGWGQPERNRTMESAFAFLAQKLR
jgi:acetyl esterase/lipase